MWELRPSLDAVLSNWELCLLNELLTGDRQHACLSELFAKQRVSNSPSMFQRCSAAVRCHGTQRFMKVENHGRR
jgi:hypothetical protein